MNIERTRKMTINDALAQIHILEQQAAVMGAQDREPSAFADIKKRLLSGEISPMQALEQAEGVLKAKQDYH